jgi:hypothetical protein
MLKKSTHNPIQYILFMRRYSFDCRNRFGFKVEVNCRNLIIGIYNNKEELCDINIDNLIDMIYDEGLIHNSGEDTDENIIENVKLCISNIIKRNDYENGDKYNNETEYIRDNLPCILYDCVTYEEYGPFYILKYNKYEIVDLDSDIFYEDLESFIFAGDIIELSRYLIDLKKFDKIEDYSDCLCYHLSDDDDNDE